MPKVTFREERCKGCGHCVNACPRKIIIMLEDKLNSKGYNPAGIIDESKCIGCAICAVMCPDVVITVEK